MHLSYSTPGRGPVFIGMLLFSVSLGCGLASLSAGDTHLKDELQSTNETPFRSESTLNSIEEAFVRGVKKVNADAFRVNDVACRISIERSTNGWLMTVKKLPPAMGGEVLVVIGTNGSTVIAPGF